MTGIEAGEIGVLFALAMYCMGIYATKQGFPVTLGIVFVFLCSAALLVMMFSTNFQG